jgi:hypothetical protein
MFWCFFDLKIVFPIVKILIFSRGELLKVQMDQGLYSCFEIKSRTLKNVFSSHDFGEYVRYEKYQKFHVFFCFIWVTFSKFKFSETFYFYWSFMKQATKHQNHLVRTWNRSKLGHSTLLFAWKTQKDF